jgi:hypothetical protein
VTCVVEAANCLIEYGDSDELQLDNPARLLHGLCSLIQHSTKSTAHYCRWTRLKSRTVHLFGVLHVI